ncbi:hypothetical protein AB0K16_22475 [Nonomuraea jabiensis]|uniref:hypothetical protein n=1 Tax=Nonomuraea jabiensis TaxID=882448 RepID=UPI00342FAB0C
MALYANYVPNPSFELNTTGWSSFNSGTPTRVGSNAFNGSYSMRIQRNGAQNSFGGASAIVNITPNAGPYTLSLYISGATEEHGASYNAGTRVTIRDLLPGQTISQGQQVAQQTFSRSTNGRVAIRNWTPRSTADRIAVIIETASTYYQAQQSSTQSSGLVWTEISLYSGGGGITNPSGTHIDASTWNNYANTGYTLQGRVDFIYREQFPEQSYNARQGTWTKTTVTSPEVNGGLSTVYVDAIQLEQGTIESTYVDGSVPGYVWSGTPHNSATLNVVQLEASGTFNMSGPDVDMLLLRFLQSGGVMGLTGTIEMTKEGTLSASGSPMGMSGSAEIWHYGAMRSGGQMAMSGGAILYSILSLEAHGTMGPGTGPATPNAVLLKTWPTGSDGTPMLMSGAVEITFPQPISASGDMLMSGTARADIGWGLVSAGEMFMSGLATLDDAIPQGAFRDFVIYSTTAGDTDPLKFGRGPSNAGANSGANGAAWNRIYGEFIAPADQPTANGFVWRRAAYAAVGFTFGNVPASNYQELACVQLEPSSADNGPGPRSYVTAKTIRPLVWADKINFSRGDWWTFFGSTGLVVTELVGTSPIPNDPFPVHELKVTSASASGFFGDNILNALPDSRCVTSVYVKGDGNIPSIKMRILNGPLAVLGESGPIFLPSGEWVRIEIPFVSDATDQIVCIDPPETVLSYPASIQVAGLMTELGTQASEYMHVVAGTQDYYYRNNGTNKLEGAFYYRNREERVPLLTEALEEHAPLSIRIGEPEFGLIPYLDA